MNKIKKQIQLRLLVRPVNPVHPVHCFFLALCG